ncbi:hypothetical protein KC343_g8920 [Hortaea werneckii]|uniref:C2H2-type domain-containing protein n=1 Tax=Hortaea werneckii TaxID=91943 RepID=A0A3M7CEN8_HORWE|nr:hypothetical protein KC352_g21044 [Hortaea werneckii]KAI7558141.1 hypothetical protein KC317_g11189 [Hortaea werneckii]KAI7602492.1 hypothetical protein KC346_g12342 [Hortaea werneckii]KAI7618910.1 hypothetical protein KC343_g8920 [Hortaea werneckii]KAI7652114.1 hypothetical protein KC319_g10748 [Hortaea werneckii]
MSESYLNSSYGLGSPCTPWGLDFQLFPDDAVGDTNAYDAFSPTADNHRPNTLWPGSSGTLGSSSFSSLNPSDISPATNLSSHISSTSSPYIYSPFSRSQSSPDILASVGQGACDNSLNQYHVDVDNLHMHCSHQLLAPTAVKPKIRLDRLPTSAPTSVSRRKGSPRHSCDVVDCGKSFSRLSDLTRHIKTIHDTASEHYHCKAMGCHHQNRRLDKIREHCFKKHGQRYDYFTQDDEVAELSGCHFANCRDFGTSSHPDRSQRRGARR